MRLSVILIIALTFSAAAALSLVAANFSVTLIEENSEIGVRDALDEKGMVWAEVEADGLQVTLSGTAPNEVVRFNALSAAGSIVDAARVIDDMEVVSQATIAAPRFSAEILRNDSGVSIIGLIPTTTDRDAAISRFYSIVGSENVADLLESANYPAPDGWEDAFAFAILAMEKLPRAKASVSAGRIDITAISDSAAEKARLEEQLRRAAPPGLSMTLDIATPRPVLTPFTLRFQITEDATGFDACSADTEKASAKITAAAKTAGATGTIRCTVGLGVPSPRWAEAVEKTIKALTEIGQGSVNFVDADITLVAAAGTDQDLFDRVVGELENALPDVFALDARLTEAVDPNAGPPEFVATLSTDGKVQLRGRLSDEELRELADSYAKASFGTDKVYTAARIVDDLPADWPTRVLSGLDALSKLANGSVIVQPDNVSVKGNTGNPDAGSQIATLLAGKLGEGQQYDIAVVYQEKLDPVLGLPTPEECEAQIGEVVKAGKINFEPGSATIDASALSTMDQIAEILKPCGDIALEIQGYTDSQGREEMNLALSQSRAQSVLNELRARRVLTASFVAKGFGEEAPVESNDTEEGREANRRIEFRLIRPEEGATTPETTLENAGDSGDTDEPANTTQEGN
ncbi:OmpA family protein [Roseobacter sp. GAI101]|uniref:OmpA family protein n=1 Tax=Roseobacter sp. (strain GAI101) TaxID=391589 RepID=UPI0001871ED5|nr:OmpA family protein [Roseobacter sp. GAI101]EEB85776.1 OmpA domain protein [Roseobacter sp. GAI101]